MSGPIEIRVGDQGFRSRQSPGPISFLGRVVDAFLILVHVVTLLIRRGVRVALGARPTVQFGFLGHSGQRGSEAAQVVVKLARVAMR